MREVDYLNNYLKTYGSDLRGRPLFRIVWSTDQFEVRFGDFCDFTESGIFLREEKQVARKLPKYPLTPDRWVLERLWFGNELNEEINRELPQAASEGSYEPLYTFQTKTGVYLPLYKPAVEYIMWTLLNYEPGQSKQETDEVLKARRKKSADDTYAYLEGKMLSGAELGEQVNGYARAVDFSEPKKFDYTANDAFDKA